MTCPECTSHILDDCLYCPKCGKPTPLSAERCVPGRRTALPTASPSSERDTLLEGKNVPGMPSHVDSRALNTLLTQANLSRMRGNWNEAVDHCVAVLQADPSNAAAHALLGDIYAARGRREDAVQWYRMALALHSNPVDEAKLHRIEREITQQETQKSGNGRRFVAVPTTLPADGQGSVGTVALMGVSPRLWLRGMAVAALMFLVGSGAVLLGTHNRHTRDNSIARPLGDSNQVNSIAPLPGSEGTLPPGRLGGPAVVPPGQAASTVSPPHEGGSGLAPDTSAAAHTVPTAFPASRQSGTQSVPVVASRPPANVPTASIRDVRPLEHGNDSPGFATLSGGMRLAKMASLTTSDEAVLVLSNPPSSSNQENFRQDAIRNVYRAARNAFATNEGAKEASVYIQTDLTEKGGTVLLVAHLDRDSALKSDPDAERPENLLNRLRSVQWGK